MKRLAAAVGCLVVCLCLPLAARAEEESESSEAIKEAITLLKQRKESLSDKREQAKLTTAIGALERLVDKKTTSKKSVDNKPRRAKPIQYFFTKEAVIKKDWQLTGDWRIEAEGVRLMNQKAELQSIKPYVGDFAIQIAYSMDKNCEIWFSMWGEIFRFEAVGTSVATLVRKGDTVNYSCAGMLTKVIKLKESQMANASPILLHLDRRNLWRPRMELVIHGIKIQGEHAADPEMKQQEQAKQPPRDRKDWVHLADSMALFQKHWRPGDSRGNVFFDSDTKTVNITSCYGLGGFSSKTKWSEFECDVEIQQLSSGNFALRVKETSFPLGPAVQKLPFSGTLLLKHDRETGNATVFLNGRKASEATVVDKTWDDSFDCMFSSSGGYNAKVKFRNVCLKP